MVDNLANEIEILPQDGYLEVRFLGAFSVATFNGKVDLAVRLCTDRKFTLLLLDYTRLSRVPTTLERYQISTHGAEAAKSLTKLAGLARADQMGEKFGTMVARNRGLNADVFTDRREALEWLLGSP